MEKLCSRCKQPKHAAAFNRCTAARDGLGAYCDICRAEYRRRPDQVEKTRQRNAAYVLSAAQKARRAEREGRPEVRARRKEQRDREKQAAYDTTRRADRARYKKTDEGKRGRRLRENRRYHQDASYRLSCCVSAGVRIALRGGKAGSSTFSLLPFSLSELVLRLESTWAEGMNWGNYGEWQVDHIQPQSLFDQTDPAQFARCWALDNLQALWAADNRAKSDHYAGA